MTNFVAGQPVTTAEPRVVVDAGLKPGFHRFRLVVVDDGGRASKPDEAVVRVVPQVITPVDGSLSPDVGVTHPVPPGPGPLPPRRTP